MPIEEYTLDPGSRRQRRVTRIIIDGSSETEAESAAISTLCEAIAEPHLDGIEQGVQRFMREQGWPDRIGLYVSNADGTQWQEWAPGEPLPSWAAHAVAHPAVLSPGRSAKRDAFEILRLVTTLRQRLAAGAPVAELVELAIELGMRQGRWDFEAQFGRATDKGITQIVGGHKSRQKRFEMEVGKHECRLAAFRNAIEKMPNDGPSTWARAVARHFPSRKDGSPAEKAARSEEAARQFFKRHRKLLGR